MATMDGDVMAQNRQKCGSTTGQIVCPGNVCTWTSKQPGNLPYFILFCLLLSIIKLLNIYELDILNLQL